MQSIAVIESYLDGCKINEVGCGCRSLWAGKRDKRDAAGRQGRRAELRDGA